MNTLIYKLHFNKWNQKKLYMKVTSKLMSVLKELNNF